MGGLLSSSSSSSSSGGGMGSPGGGDFGGSGGAGVYSTYSSGLGSGSGGSGSPGGGLGLGGTGGFRTQGYLSSPHFTPDLNAAWRQFKVTPGLGAEAAAAVQAAKGAHAQARAGVSARARVVNAAKKKVDALAASLAEVKARSSRAASPAPPSLEPGPKKGGAGASQGPANGVRLFFARLP